MCALVPGGGYSEVVAVPQGHLFPIPSTLSVVEAAALPEVISTVWLNMIDIGRLRAGESALIHGGSGGVGSAAIQLARAIGARVFATAGSKVKAEACLSLGADVAIRYDEEDFPSRLLEATQNKGADLVLDPIGGEYLQRNVKCLAEGGRLAVIGLQRGLKGELNLARLLSKQGTVFATSLRTRSREEKARIVRGVTSGVWPLIESGSYRPVIGKVFPIEQPSSAHTFLESGQNIGKVLLRHQAAGDISPLDLTVSTADGETIEECE